jgi:predicted permease
VLHELLVALFITTAGLTASGIVANVYRLIVGKTEPARALYLAVMVVAGPSVLFDNAARSRLKKECSHIAFWLAAALALYWSLAFGLFVVSLALVL